MTDVMRAAVVDGYGAPELVSVREVARPSPKDHQLLVRVLRSAVTSGDARIRSATFPKGMAPLARLAFGVRGPRNPILGGSFSGVVESVGSAVTEFAPGDAVCGMTGARMGAHAEFVAVNALKSVVHKPAAVSHDDAAAVLFGGTTALAFVRDKGAVRAGQRVLVVGASGAVGTNCVQVAARAGAAVTAVCSSTNADLVSSLGASEVIAYDREAIGERSTRYDLVVDTVGALSVAEGIALLTPDGRLALVAADLGQMMRPNKRVLTGTAGERAADMATLLDLVARHELRVVVDETFDLADIAEAYRRVDSGHKVGNLVLRIAD